MKMSTELYSMLVNQSAHELQNSVIYSNIRSYLKFKGLEGLSKHFDGQRNEEFSHNNMICQFLDDRNEMHTIPTVESMSFENFTIKQIIEFYLKREQETTMRIEKMIEQAENDGDRLSYTFLLDFVAKQRAEEDEAQTMYDRIVASGLCENMPLLILYDNGLGD